MVRLDVAGARDLRELRDALDAFAAAGHGVRRPVRAVVEQLALPAFTETQFDRHVLHLQAEAAAEPWLPGLLAREVAHMALTDSGHGSHDPALLMAGFDAAKQRSRELAFLAGVGMLNHHVRDLYADDLAHHVAPDALAPFLAHLAERAARFQGTHLEVAVEAGYAAATLVRRGQVAPPALAQRLAASPDARRLADALAGLHPRPEPADLERAVARLVALLPMPDAPR